MPVEQQDAVGARVMLEEMAGQADLVAAAGAEPILLEPGDVDRHHGHSCGTSPLAGSRGFCRLGPILDKVPSMLRGGSLLQVLVMAISIAPALLMLAVLAIERWDVRPPPGLSASVSGASGFGTPASG